MTSRRSPQQPAEAAEPCSCQAPRTGRMRSQAHLSVLWTKLLEGHLRGVFKDHMEAFTERRIMES